MSALAPQRPCDVGMHDEKPDSTDWFEAWYWDGKQAWGFAEGQPGIVAGVGDQWTEVPQGCGHGVFWQVGVAKLFPMHDPDFKDKSKSWASRNKLIPGGVDCAGGLNSGWSFAPWSGAGGRGGLVSICQRILVLLLLHGCSQP